MKQLRWTTGLGSLVGTLAGVPPLVIAGVIIIVLAGAMAERIIVLAGGIAEQLGLELVRASDQRTVTELLWRRRSAPPSDADPPGPEASTDEDS